MGGYFDVGVFLLSRAVTSQVSSAPTSLTSVFGMGTGGPSLSSTPTTFIAVSLRLIYNTTVVLKMQAFFSIFLNFFAFPKRAHFREKNRIPHMAFQAPCAAPGFMSLFVLFLSPGSLGMIDLLCSQKRYAQYMVFRLLATYRFKRQAQSFFFLMEKDRSTVFLYIG